MNNIMMPPLRLILNSSCNGQCSYCHKEGYDGALTMSAEIIAETITAAKKLALPVISLTGGEPTLRDDLAEIVSQIVDMCPDIKIHLTTNGYCLKTYIGTKVELIDTLNLSFTSFRSEIASKYQNVEPTEALEAFKKIGVKNKNLNVVIGKDNFMEIDKIVEYCLNEGVSLDLMFALDATQDAIIHKCVFNVLNRYDVPFIQLKATPTLAYNINNQTRIRIKHPALNRWISRNICRECQYQHTCFERVCAVRVYPDGVITPCLNKNIYSSQTTLLARIEDIYSAISEEIYDLLLK